MTTQQSSTHVLPTLLLSLLPNIGVHRYWELVNTFGSATAVLDRDPETIPLFHASAKTLIRDYQQQGKNSRLMTQANSIIDSLSQHNGVIICIEQESYPPLLKDIYHPPPLLYIKGGIDNLYLPQLAIVGSRHASHHGLENTRLFANHLAQHGFAITSGLALGIDHAAHQAALSAKAKTIAVMATGIDSIYPKRHTHIADQIVDEGGTLVTEFPPSTPPKADHFPRRNRVISGLSLGVIVVEAAIKSGSLITARYALEQNREVFAIPGSIHNPHNKGCHQLIKNGATLVESSQDIIDHLGAFLAHLNITSTISMSDKITKDINTLSDNEKLIIQLMGFESSTIDELITSSQLPSQLVIACLATLEMNGWIKRSAWGYERV